MHYNIQWKDFKCIHPLQFISLIKQARDNFFQCVEDAGVSFSLETSTPRQCKSSRKAFEQLCKPSWVRHFDISRDKELRLLQTLRTNIYKSAPTATGTLSGSDQRESSPSI